MKSSETKKYVSFAFIAILIAIFAREKINSIWGLKTDWDLFNGIANLIGLGILGLGYEAVRKEIQSREEERNMRKYETLLTIREKLFEGEFTVRRTIFIENYLNEWPKENYDDCAKSFYYCLVTLNTVQKLIDQNILDFDDVFRYSWGMLIQFEKATSSFSKIGNRNMDFGEFINFPKAFKLLECIKKRDKFEGEKAKKMLSNGDS